MAQDAIISANVQAMAALWIGLSVYPRTPTRHIPCFGAHKRHSKVTSGKIAVPLPWSDAAAVDPEEMFVASLSSCHMLWFLSIAAQQRYCVDSYRDHATGTMGNNSGGKLVVTRVSLRPAVVFPVAASPTPPHWRPCTMKPMPSASSPIQ